MVSMFVYFNKLLLFIISYSYTVALRGLNGTKTLSNTILYYFKVIMNVHYIENKTVLGHKKTWKSIQLPSVDDKMNHSSR